MAMDFFAHQEDARRRSRWLVFYFALALLGVSLALYFGVGTLLFFGTQDGPEARHSGPFLQWIWDPQAFLGTTGAVLLVMGGASLFKILELSSQGGAAVAKMVGGELVDPATATASERQLLNVVEEISIASGIPVPPVYLLRREAGINAFAAGFSPDKAVIAVTRGALETLTRDELQGVIAHEYSHILNGDMRMNIQLIGWIHGVVVIAAIGRILMEVASRSRSSSRSSKGNGAQLGFLLVGLAVFVIGSIGVFFARLIQAAVSRQREFLADAAAVQFTRQPDGIAGALKKIGGLASGARVSAAAVDSVSHLFFGEAVSSWSSLFDTHPPLLERIRRIDPSFNGLYPLVEPGAATGRAGGFSPQASPLAAGLAAAAPPMPQDLNRAAARLAALPAKAAEAARSSELAPLLLFALFLDRRNSNALPQGMAALQRNWQGPLDKLPETATTVFSLELPQRLLLLDLAVASLKRQPPAVRRRLLDTMQGLAQADKEISLLEYAVLRYLNRNLGTDSGKDNAQYWSWKETAADADILLSLLAWHGAAEAREAGRVFQKAAAVLGTSFVGVRGLLPAEHCGLDQADAALARLALMPPMQKQKLLNACLTAIHEDGQVSETEQLLAWAVAAILGCPAPLDLLAAA